MKCRDLNLQICDFCSILPAANYCIIETYSNWLTLLNDKELKLYIMDEILNSIHREYYILYFLQTAIHLFPKRLSLIEKILILR